MNYFRQSEQQKSQIFGFGANCDLFACSFPVDTIPQNIYANPVSSPFFQLVFWKYSKFVNISIWTTCFGNNSTVVAVSNQVLKILEDIFQFSELHLKIIQRVSNIFQTFFPNGFKNISFLNFSQISF